jgi:hypothetical protein
MKREDQQDATIRCLLLTSLSTCFEHHYAHLQEKHVETEVNNKHLIVASCLVFLSLHTLLTMHGHRNLKRTN